MKMLEVQKIGLRPKTIAEMEVNIGDIITSDEFNNRLHGAFLGGEKVKDYRQAAIERLVDMKIPFESNQNIVVEMFRKYVSVTCPHCGSKMDVSCCGGNGDCYHVNYHCTNDKCNTVVNLKTDHNGFGVTPYEKH